MHRNSILQIFIASCSIILSSCDNNNQDIPNNTPSIQKDESTTEKAEGLPIDFLGNYQGNQPSYFMKNQYGDDMIINGNKVSVPSIDNKFLLKENNVVSLQQINLENNSRVYYEGTFKIISDDSNTFKIKCSLSDGQSSNPSYTITINKADKKGICNGSNEPQFSVEKIK